MTDRGERTLKLPAHAVGRGQRRLSARAEAGAYPGATPAAGDVWGVYWHPIR